MYLNSLRIKGQGGWDSIKTDGRSLWVEAFFFPRDRCTLWKGTHQVQWKYSLCLWLSIKQGILPGFHEEKLIQELEQCLKRCHFVPAQCLPSLFSKRDDFCQIGSTFPPLPYRGRVLPFPAIIIQKRGIQLQHGEDTSWEKEGWRVAWEVGGDRTWWKVAGRVRQKGCFRLVWLQRFKMLWTWTVPKTSYRV